MYFTHYFSQIIHRFQVSYRTLPSIYRKHLIGMTKVQMVRSMI